MPKIIELEQLNDTHSLTIKDSYVKNPPFTIKTEEVFKVKEIKIRNNFTRKK